MSGPYEVEVEGFLRRQAPQTPFRIRSQVNVQRLRQATRVSATVVMKLVSPIQRGKA